jgi:hypothetical protein
VNTGALGAGGLDVGVVNINTWYSLYAGYNFITNTRTLFACLSATSSGPVYTGGNLPAGFLATAFVSSWKTNGAGLWQAGCQKGREIDIVAVQAASNLSSSSFVGLALTGVLPPNATKIKGQISVISNSNASLVAVLYLGSTATPIGQQFAQIPGGLSGGTNSYFELLLTSGLTIYYETANANGNGINVTGYSI